MRMRMRTFFTLCMALYWNTGTGLPPTQASFDAVQTWIPLEDIEEVRLTQRQELNDDILQRRGCKGHGDDGEREENHHEDSESFLPPLPHSFVAKLPSEEVD